MTDVLRGMPLEDLVAEGIIGLMKGVERFDPGRGFKFSTYAHWWIRQAVSRSISDQARVIRFVSFRLLYIVELGQLCKCTTFRYKLSGAVLLVM